MRLILPFLYIPALLSSSISRFCLLDLLRKAGQIKVLDQPGTETEKTLILRR